MSTIGYREDDSDDDFVARSPVETIAHRNTKAGTLRQQALNQMQHSSILAVKANNKSTMFVPRPVMMNQFERDEQEWKAIQKEMRDNEMEMAGKERMQENLDKAVATQRVNSDFRKYRIP